MPRDLHPGTEERLDRISALLRTEFAEIPPASVERVVDAVTQELLENATIEDFVPVLVHRHSRERLRANAGSRRHDVYSRQPGHDRRIPRHGRSRRRS